MWMFHIHLAISAFCILSFIHVYFIIFSNSSKSYCVANHSLLRLCFQFNQYIFKKVIVKLDRSSSFSDSLSPGLHSSSSASNGSNPSILFFRFTLLGGIKPFITHFTVAGQGFDIRYSRKNCIVNPTTQVNLRK